MSRLAASISLNRRFQYSIFLKTNRSLFSTTSSPPTAAVVSLSDLTINDDALSFSRIVQSRRSAFSFDSSRSIPRTIIDNILEATIRSPSGFNFSPYRLVLVEDEDKNKTNKNGNSNDMKSESTASISTSTSTRASGETSNRSKLAKAMVGAGNIERVLEAPLSIVFVSDFQSTNEIDAVTARELAAGTRSMQYLRSLPLNAQVFTGNSNCATNVSLRFGSAFAPLPIPSSAEAWAFKQAGFAAMSMLLAASANGIGSHAMEGFDTRRVLTAIGAPTNGRWGVPVIISLGYGRTSGHPSEEIQSVRPKRSEIVYSSNQWGEEKKE